MPRYPWPMGDRAGGPLLGPKGGGVAPEFPETLAGLEFWFDASDLSTVTTDVDGVNNWADKSSNGRDVSQAGQFNKPQQTTDGAFDAIQFDGANDVLNSVSLSISGANGYTYFQAYRFFAASSGTDTMFIALASAGTALQFAENSTNQAQFLINVSSGSSCNINIPSFKGTAKAAIVGRGTSNGSDGLLEFDEGTTGTDNNIGMANDIDGIVSIGAQDTGGASTPIYMFECGMYSRSLDNTEFANLLSYLKTKWGV